MLWHRLGLRTGRVRASTDLFLQHDERRREHAHPSDAITCGIATMPVAHLVQAS